MGSRGCFVCDSLFLDLMGIIAGGITNILIIIAELTVSVVFGLSGNSWRESNLESRGYEFKMAVEAETPDGATVVFLRESEDDDF